ncbi:homoserine dehydrogenase [Lentisphaera araneosa HTCC2155]|uniref:Homoserine dehydrogenase n=1 Tax=Lentisphaera araneosa HTCC2155 TaxID=313628 RepID=A6DTD1_9BACT|nr:homoserine dehydrogenase [Lentisphaera araneosa]EDM25111.1 homoserine dehydrogenase [Lentisphaera araneosa HTCC2155]
MKEIKIGLLGLGTVASGLVNAIADTKELLAKRNNYSLSIAGIAVRDLNAKRACEVDSSILTTDTFSIVNNPEVDIVLELIGGTTLAYDLVKKALENGKSVVSANKALIAAHGEELFKLAEDNKTAIFFEAAVAGGIPIIKALKESLAGNHVTSISGILNGTCNYILTQMQENDQSFEDALQGATDLGYAEADPSLDIDGDDTAQKTAILASLAYGTWFGTDAIEIKGIRGISLSDIQYAKESGYSIKLLGSYTLNAKGAVALSTECTLVREDSMLGNVKGAFNAVELEGDLLGPGMLYGQGAGQKPTASSVFADLIEAGSQFCNGTLGQQQKMIFCDKAEFIPQEEQSSPFYLRLMLEDCPAVFGKVALILGEHGISMDSVLQKAEASADGVKPVVIQTHEVSVKAMKEAVAEIQASEYVHEQVILYPIKG